MPEISGNIYAYIAVFQRSLCDIIELCGKTLTLAMLTTYIMYSRVKAQLQSSVPQLVKETDG